MVLTGKEVASATSQKDIINWTLPLQHLKKTSSTGRPFRIPHA
jgi:hypothetical protein